MILPSLLGGLLIYIVSQIILSLYGEFKLSPCTNLLVIGVFSAQNHSDRRQMIRQTWGSLTDNCQSILKFVIGDEICPIPPTDRLTPHVCESWTPQLPQSDSTQKNFEISKFGSLRVFTSYTFTVKQPVTLTEISICSNLLTDKNRRARVVVKNSRTDEIVASASFIFDERTSLHSEGVQTKRIGSARLEPDFEGELSVVSTELFDCHGCQMVLTEKTPLPIFECFSQSDGFVPKSSLDVQPTVVAGLGYYIDHFGAWENYLKNKSIRAKEWDFLVADLKRQLQQEAESYGDIFWVNHIDTYSALSSKLLIFLNWVSSTEYIYVLKTDDDVFVNLTAVLEELSLGKSDWDWWSCFHKKGWLPPNSGKWRDRLSNSREYPAFPSGAGYVLRVSSVRRMNMSVIPTAGEDVTVGRMADGKGFVALEKSTCYWACGYQSNSLNPCNVPELDPNQMNITWNSFRR
ncbi:Beta-1,3-N-acetylgalactosaminyltransferase 2 [Nesidiocoris tenuis]|uniref:Hexosyltransferase n=1 Tax=Nesidiocoris tenuis TaxID=355587 RepID=A0ABN7ARN6_9HEMI|nr:Beta-1,3-N-acetylgalactosaminyltransferase 2 [Nesidiocoris tenuis]